MGRWVKKNKALRLVREAHERGSEVATPGRVSRFDVLMLIGEYNRRSRGRSLGKPIGARDLELLNLELSMIGEELGLLFSPGDDDLARMLQGRAREIMAILEGVEIFGMRGV